jgi:hypothetical protein
MLTVGTVEQVVGVTHCYTCLQDVDDGCCGSLVFGSVLLGSVLCQRLQGQNGE